MDLKDVSDFFTLLIKLELEPLHLIFIALSLTEDVDHFLALFD